MTKNLLIPAGLTLLLCLSQTSFAEDVDHMRMRVQQEEMQYKQNAEALRPFDEKMNALNQQIKAVYDPLNAKYKSFDETLQKIAQPYQEQINKLNQQIHAAEAPYTEQIKQRNEEYHRAEWQTKQFREEEQRLKESTWQLRKSLEEQRHELDRSRAELKQQYQRGYQSTPSNYPQNHEMNTVTQQHVAPEQHIPSQKPVAQPTQQTIKQNTTTTTVVPKSNTSSNKAVVQPVNKQKWVNHIKTKTVQQTKVF